jgi:hypothetical protein
LRRGHEDDPHLLVSPSSTSSTKPAGSIPSA